MGVIVIDKGGRRATNWFFFFLFFRGIESNHIISYDMPTNDLLRCLYFHGSVNVEIFQRERTDRGEKKREKESVSPCAAALRP